MQTARISMVLGIVAAWLMAVLPAAGQGVSKAAPAGPAVGGGAGGGAGGPPVPVEVTARASFDAAAPGEQVLIAVVLDHDEGWHSWPADIHTLRKDFGWTIPTSITVTVDAGGAGAVVGAVQWPTTKEEEVPSVTGVGKDRAPVYGGRAVAFVPVQVAADAAAGTSVVLKVEVTQQSCDATSCLQPETTRLELTVPVVSVTERKPAEDQAEFAAFDQTRWATAFTEAGGVSGGGAAKGIKVWGLTLPAPDSFAGALVITLLAALGGVVLNLTPCVLPVIPLKVMAISQHAGSPGKSLMLGAVMASGVVAFWLAIGAVAVTFTTFADPTRLFSYWFVPAGIGLLIVVMSVGLLGLFELSLPQGVYMFNPKADSLPGSFMFGVMTAVLGLPCFGFVAGALLGASATMPKAVIVAIFAGIGIGMALPYLVLAARPQWVSKIPRTGPASTLVKQVLGLMLLAAGAYFLGSGVNGLLGGMPEVQASLPWWAKAVQWWFVGLFLASSGVWLAWRTLKLTQKAIGGAFVALGVILLAAGGALGTNFTIEAKHNFWKPFSAEAFEAALDTGEVVVLDFTADWCLTCKGLEAAVLSQAPVRPLLTGEGVIAIKADLTSDAAPGWVMLREQLNRTGIPTLAIFGPGQEEPWIRNAYTAEDVVQAIRKARG